MKNKLIMILAAVLMVGLCGLTQVMPAFATSNIDSRGNMIFEDGDVAFYSADIEELNADVTDLSTELPAASYAKEQDKTLKNDIKSKGIINYDSGKVIFNSGDLIKLADGIADLNVGYKSEAVRALNKIGTYFKDDGSVTYDENSGVVSPENASKLSFSNICTGILKSQSVEHLASQGVNAAIRDNLSDGSAAWVNGELLIGNGNDNKASYDQGYKKGYEDGEASVPRTGCYFLGTSSEVSSDGSIVYNIAKRVPGVDYTKLTAENFIICPYRVNGIDKTIKTSLNVDLSVTAVCYLSGCEIKAARYDAETGLLSVDKPTMSAMGGLKTINSMKIEMTTDLDFYVYLIVGDIVNCA